MVRSANAITDHRCMVKVPPRMRRRCWCGCGKRATHTGLAAGVAMTHGCEMLIRRWVKNPTNAVLAVRRTKS
jgi:hypothetical protein